MKRALSQNLLFIIGALSFSMMAYGELVDERFNQQQQHHQAQQEAREARLIPQPPDILTQTTDTPSTDSDFPQENPCFPIRTVTLEGKQDFPFWAPLQYTANKGIGHCLGVQGINHLMSNLQNQLINHGWVTSRVLAPEQDLNTGELKLTLIPGKLSHIRYQDGSDSRAVMYSAMPAHEGNLLDLRDIEQGLENMQRLPTVDAKMDIIPGKSPGESDVVITRKQSKIWRVNTWVDDSGTKSTGRYQGGAMLALDNPFALSDVFYLAASHDLGFQGKKQTKNLAGHYSVPFGYWLFEINASRYKYIQNVAGLNSDIRYAGRSKNLNADLSRVIFRNGSAKTTLHYGIQYKENRNYINDDEVEVQRRRTSAWILGVDHRQYIGNTTFDLGVNYQRGTRWFGAMPAYEEKYPHDQYETEKAKIFTWAAGMNLPFSIVDQAFSYQINYLRQMSTTPLTSPDQLSIGNRWTVRGFDGERTLSATRGWYLQNTLAWKTPLPNQELYLGADYGEVSGRSDSYSLIGHHLAGGVMGLRGSVSSWNISYDTFAGIPFSKPSGFKTDSVTLGFSVNWQY